MGRPSKDLDVNWGPAHKWYISTDRDSDGRSEGAWDDLTADLSAGRAVGANAPTWATFRDGLSAYSFANNTMNEVWINFHILHDIDEGSLMFPHIHWGPNTTATGTVRWGFEYTMAKGHQQEAFPASTTVYVNDTIAVNSQFQHRVAEVAEAQALVALEPDSLILCRIFRDASHIDDTFPNGAFGFTADIHYQKTKWGTINKSPDFNAR